jgi:hypothetical protein
MEYRRRPTMSEMDNNLRRLRAKTCILAIASFVLALAAFVLTVDFFFFMTIHLPNFPLLNILIAGVSLLLSVILGQIAGSSIKKSKPESKAAASPLTLLLLVAGVMNILLMVSVFAVVVFNKQLKNLAYGGGRIEAIHARINLRRVYRSMRMYARDFQGRYPAANNWCDLLIEHEESDQQFVKANLYSPLADANYYYHSTEPNKEPNAPVELLFDHNFVNWAGEHYYAYSPKLCHYAINPDCTPNSPNDVVLLFGTQAGWNQHGGPEIMKFDHLKGRRAIVLHNDGLADLISPKDVDNLKWKGEDANTVK